MLTVEIGLQKEEKIPEIVEIYLDNDGLDDLLRRLSLIKDGKTDHIHLMTKSWGLGDLSDKKHREENVLAQHLKITLLG